MATLRTPHVAEPAASGQSRRIIEPVMALAITLMSPWWLTESATLVGALGYALLALGLVVGARLASVGFDFTRLETALLGLLIAHAVIFPAVYVVLGFTRLPLAELDVRRALAAHVTLIGAAWTTWATADLIRPLRAPRIVLMPALTAWASARGRSGGQAMIGAALLAAIATLVYAASTGYFFAFGGADRRLVYLATGEEQLWYLRYAVQGVLLWSLAFGFGRPDLRRVRRASLIGVGVFMLAVIGTGGRRDVVGVLLPLMLLLYLSAETGRGRALIVGVLLLALGGLVAFAALRTWGTTQSATDLLTLYQVLGEVLFPWQVTGYLVANPPEPLLGASYVYPLVLWIPRVVWSEKPVILAEQFSAMAGTTSELGFGFSPVAEAIWNFGMTAGPWIGGVFVALAMRLVSARAGHQPLLYLMVVGRVLSVPRSELASILGEVLILSVVFVGCDWMARGIDWLFPDTPPRPPVGPSCRESDAAPVTVVP